MNIKIPPFLVIILTIIIGVCWASDEFIDGYAVENTQIQQFEGMAVQPNVAPSGDARIYYDVLDDALYSSTNGGAYAEIGAGGSGSWSNTADNTTTGSLSLNGNLTTGGTFYTQAANGIFTFDAGGDATYRRTVTLRTDNQYAGAIWDSSYGIQRFDDDLLILDGQSLNVGSSSDGKITWNTTGDDHMVIGPSSAGALLFMESGDRNDADRAPTNTGEMEYYFYGKDADDANDYIKFRTTSSGNDISAGQGDLGLADDVSVSGGLTIGDKLWIAGDVAGSVSLSTSDGTGLINGFQDKDITIFQPDSVNDEIAVFHVDAKKYPYGITLTQLSITIPSDAAYSMVFEEWAGDPATAQNDIETVTTGGTDSYMEVAYGDINDSAIDADDYIFLHIPATDVDWIQVKIIFIANEA